MSQFKQVIVLREAQGMSKGKQISQACHASLKSYEKADSKVQEKWKKQGSKKVVVDAGENKLEERFERAKTLQMPAALVKDAGLTEVEPGTVTALGIGPGEENKIDKVTGDLKLIK